MDTSQDSTTSQRKLPVTEADIQKMLQTKDFYQILGVSKTATDEDLKRQYKKLALKYHPDKLRLPGAQEVFKKIAHAYTTLTDPDKRAYYDRTGSDQPQQTRAYEQQYEDFDPTDIFSAFFPGFQFQQGGGFGGQRRHYQYHYRRGGDRQEEGERGQRQQGSGFMGILQLIPFFLIMFSGFFSSFFQESPDFSLNRTSQFGIHKKSIFLNINYFVDSNFEDKVMENVDYLPNFEWKVENEYINDVNMNCRTQQSKKRQYEHLARMSWTNAEQQKNIRLSKGVDMSPCEELDDLSRKYNIERYF